MTDTQQSEQDELNKKLASIVEPAMKDVLFNDFNTTRLFSCIEKIADVIHQREQALLEEVEKRVITVVDREERRQTLQVIRKKRGLAEPQTKAKQGQNQ